MFSLGPGLIVQQFIEATAFVDDFSCQQVKTVTILTHLCIKHPRGWSNLKSHPHLADPSVAHSNFGTMWTESHERPLCVYRDRVESTHETTLFKSSFQAQKSSHLWQPILQAQKSWGLQPKDGCEQAEGLVHWVTPLNKLRLPGLDCSTKMRQRYGTPMVPPQTHTARHCHLEPLQSRQPPGRIGIFQALLCNKYIIRYVFIYSMSYICNIVYWTSIIYL